MKETGNKKQREGEVSGWQTQHGLSGERHRAYSSFLRSYAAVLRRVECLSRSENTLPAEWYDVLLALEYAPEGRLRIGELSCHVTVSRSGITRLVDKLEAAGLVDRKMNPNDRRSFEVILTDKGREERARAWPGYARIIQEVFGACYSDEEATLLANLLERHFKENQAGTCDAASGSCNAPTEAD